MKMEVNMKPEYCPKCGAKGYIVEVEYFSVTTQGSYDTMDLVECRCESCTHVFIYNG